MAAHALLNQRVDWHNRIITTFDKYADERQGSSDVSEDFIMDVTAGSSLVKTLSDDVYDLVVQEAPTLPGTFAELGELNELIHDKSSFQELCDLVYNILLNTKFMFNVVDRVLRGAFDDLGMSRDTSEVAIHGSGERRNSVKDLTEKTDRCNTADIVGYDSSGGQMEAYASHKRYIRLDLEKVQYAERVLPYSRYSMFGIHR
ncbi:hypothetical protein EC968_002354 [Mortierella alpina]|nr:hypothetical protein EC968_002354 [Mortierella alpina]